MSHLYSNSIFWIEVDKILPNPFQPRREFDENALRDLADSIRQYGILQPLTVSRLEKETPEGGLVVEYELIAGERRLRASKLAGLREVPVVIRVGDDNMAKLELAIIENLQREDLNAVERARAFLRLVNEFGFTHTQIGKKMGKSREYVSNSMRLLGLPQEMLDALSHGKISEGHTRPIMMLNNKPDEQMVLFKEIVYKKISVREAERLARLVATDKVRKKELLPDPEIHEIENRLQESLGTRVHIERKENGGKILIDFFSSDDLNFIVELLKSNQSKKSTDMLDQFIATQVVVNPEESTTTAVVAPIEDQLVSEMENLPTDVTQMDPTTVEKDVEQEMSLLDDRTKDELQKSEEDTDLYNVKNFSL
jgi:ParB family chromosome partitioning protein